MMSLILNALFTLYLLSLPRNTIAVKDVKNTSEKRSTRLERTSLNPHSDDHEIDYSKQDETVRNLVKWSIAKGGYIHPQVEIRRWDPSDPTSYFGAFVNGPVQKGEELIKIPGSIKIQLEDFFRADRFTYGDTVCELAWALKKEYELGEESKYAPYIEYIKTQSKHQIPAMWSDLGKHLMTKVQGDLSIMDLNQDAASGEHMHDWIDDYFGEESCLVDTDTGEEMEEWFVAMAIQRGFDVCLIPIYDMINHHNGLQNTLARESIYDKDGFGVYAVKDLNAGDELFFSYHDCLDCEACPTTCGTSHNHWRTPEIVRDFGFVEAYPQRFYYEDMGPVYLKIDEHLDGGFRVTNEGGEWPEIAWIESQIERLKHMYDLQIYPLRNALPSHELETIINYHKSLLKLFTTYHEDHHSKELHQEGSEVRENMENEDADSSGGYHKEDKEIELVEEESAYKYSTEL